MAIYSKRSLKALTGLNPKLVHIMMEAIRETPVDYTVTDGFRTTAQQKALYAKGRTKEGKIVTNADGVYNKSKHQSGNAVDIYPYINGKIDINDKENKLPIIAKHIKKTAERLGYQRNLGDKQCNSITNKMDIRVDICRARGCNNTTRRI